MSRPFLIFVLNHKDMGEHLKHKILNSIGSIYESAKDCKLSAIFFDKIDAELHQLSEYLNVSKSQSFLISMVFALNYKGSSVDLSDLIEYFNSNPVKILEYIDDLDELTLKGLLVRQKRKRNKGIGGISESYTVDERISQAIIKNNKLPEIRHNDNFGIIELLEKLYDLGNKRDEEEISTDKLFSNAEELISSHSCLPLIKKVNSFAFHIKAKYVYLYLIWKTISGNESINISRALEGIFEHPTERITYLQEILSGEHVLVKENLIEIVEARFFNDTEIKLTEHSYDILSDSDLNHFKNRKKPDNIIAPDNIPYRKLVYAKDEVSQLELLSSLLEEDNLQKTQNRLLENNMPPGIIVLLYGASGTGKTESVLQLAKKTNRQIYKVDISKSKSMWFGESEKITKKIFTDYKTFAKKCEQTPILLFNEADAIISVRKDIGTSVVDNTENTIQNILLEELEGFEGILIATTNLASNIDKAFERRFLFKIKFNQPSLWSKREIWKLKLPSLSVPECDILAAGFDFTGGQIDNIVRKNTMNEIIYGSPFDFDSIMNLCKEEGIVINRNVIGFSKS